MKMDWGRGSQWADTTPRGYGNLWKYFCYCNGWEALLAISRWGQGFPTSWIAQDKSPAKKKKSPLPFK